MTEYSSQRIITKDLGINNCGIQPLCDCDYHTVRSRIDYTLMYVASGKATVYINNTEFVANKGEAILFLPNAKQDFVFKQKDKSLNKWVHFSGKLCSVLDGQDARIIKISSVHEFESNIDRLIRAYCRVNGEKELLCDGYMRAIIAILTESERKQEYSGNTVKSRLDEVLNYINVHINEQIDFDKCANMCFISRDRFNHIFKEYTGLSPKSYLLQIRIERAKQLLGDLDMSSEECAEMLGFCDVNHFCRTFKKRTGYTPKQFKKI